MGSRQWHGVRLNKEAEGKNLEHTHDDEHSKIKVRDLDSWLIETWRAQGMISTNIEGSENAKKIGSFAECHI